MYEGSGPRPASGGEHAAGEVRMSTVIIYTTDLPGSSAFYREALDLPDPDTDIPGHVGWKMGEAYFGFDSIGSWAGKPPSAVTLWFSVPDLFRVHGRFLALGAKERMAPERKSWGAILSALYDPQGNIVGLHQSGT